MAEESLLLPAGPPPEPAKRDDDPDNRPPGALVAVSNEKHEAAPGEVIGARMVEMLAVRPGQKAAAAASAVIELPFTQENGQPYLQLRPPKSGTVILPFPDANGNLVEVPIPTGPRSQTADFPVVNPRAPDASSGKTAGRRPGPGGSDR